MRNAYIRENLSGLGFLQDEWDQMKGFLKGTELETISLSVKAGWQGPHQCQLLQTVNTSLILIRFCLTLPSMAPLLNQSHSCKPKHEFICLGKDTQTRDQNKIRHHCSKGEQITPPNTILSSILPPCPRPGGNTFLTLDCKGAALPFTSPIVQRVSCGAMTRFKPQGSIC